MGKIAIDSPLTGLEWKHSFLDKVVDDSKKGTRAYTGESCFFGRFVGDQYFRLYHHAAFESKSMSLGLYCFGQIEDTEDGCKVVGRISRKTSAIAMLVMGCILSVILLIASITKGTMSLAITGVVLFIICFFVLISSPSKDMKLITKELDRISTDEKYISKGKRLRIADAPSVNSIANKASMVSNMIIEDIGDYIDDESLEDVDTEVEYEDVKNVTKDKKTEEP